MKDRIIWAALIIALGIAAAGGFICNGMRKNASMNRYVRVRGLSVREVAADIVTWAVYFKEVGNDLQALYRTINPNQCREFYGDCIFRQSIPRENWYRL